MCTDLSCDVVIGILAWTVAGLLCVVFLRRAIINFGDPLIAINVEIPFSAALLAVLCATNLVDSKKLLVFYAVLLGYLLGCRTATAFFGRERFRDALIRTVSRLRRSEVFVIVLSTIVITFILAVLAVQAGAQGDARQDFAHAFRPLITLQSGLFLFSLIALLSPKLSTLEIVVLLIVLISLTIAFSGKSVLIPIFYWFGLRFFAANRRSSLATITLLAFGVFAGVGVMGVIAYGTSSSAQIFYLITNRLWLSGDVYIYAYQMDALSYIRDNFSGSFLSYMFHPVTSLFGVRGYEKPLGSMISSQITRADILTGPNPQLPVLLDFFFPNEFVTMILIAFAVGCFVIFIRLVGTRMAEGRGRFLAIGGVAIATFCPATGFIDTSQVLISIIGILSVIVLGSLLEITNANPLINAEPVR